MDHYENSVHRITPVLQAHIPSSAYSNDSLLKKYFSSEEISRFMKYQRHVVMSTPDEMQSFYRKLSQEELKRFQYFVKIVSQNEQQSKVPRVPVASVMSSASSKPVSFKPSIYGNESTYPLLAYPYDRSAQDPRSFETRSYAQTSAFKSTYAYQDDERHAAEMGNNSVSTRRFDDNHVSKYSKYLAPSESNKMPTVQ